MFLGIVYILGAILMGVLAFVITCIIEKTESKDALGKATVVLYFLGLTFILLQGAIFLSSALDIFLN